MADNYQTNAGSGGPTFASDDDATAHHPYVKVEWGADNAYNKTSVAAPIPVQIVPQSTADGATPHLRVATGDTNEVNLKASAGTVYSVIVTNTNAAVRYLKLYNKASAPTSSDTPVHSFAVPGTSTGGGVALSFPVGIKFDTGIGYRMTTGYANADTGALTAGDCLLNVTYK